MTPDGPAEDLRHPRVALDQRRGDRVPPADLLAGAGRDERGHRRLGGVDLTERGQDVADVGQEAVVGPHHQHPGTGELVAIGVQQIGRPVQADRRLAGARGTLDTHRAGQRRPDDAVLFRLDGGHDVAHRAGARALDLRLQDRRRVRLLAGGGSDQVLVLVRGQLPGAEAEPAAPTDGHRISRPCLVEGQRHLGPPVDHHRLTPGLPGDVAAADVERLVRFGTQCGLVVEPAEEERDARIVLQRLHPPVEGLLQVLGGDMVAADGGQSRRVLTHPAQRRPGLGEMVRSWTSGSSVLGGSGGGGRGHDEASDRLGGGRGEESRYTGRAPALQLFSPPRFIGARCPDPARRLRRVSRVSSESGRAFTIPDDPRPTG